MFNINKNSTFTGMAPEKTDVYVGIAAAILSQFTKNGHVLMGFFGLVYGFAFIKTMRRFISIQPEDKFLSYIPVFLAAFMMPISQLAGIRYGTATYFFVWAVLEIISTRRLKYYSLFVVAVLIHFSFVVPVALFVMYRFLTFRTGKNYIKVLYVIYIISFFFPNLISNIIGNASFLSFVGDGAQQKASEYTNNDVNSVLASNFVENAAWFIKIPNVIFSWFLYSILFVRILPAKKIFFSAQSDKIFSWVMILTSFSNYSLGVSNLGNRLLMIASIFIFYYLLRLYFDNKENKIVKTIIMLALIFSGLKIILELRFILQYTTPIFFYGTSYHIFTDNAYISVGTYLFN